LFFSGQDPEVKSFVLEGFTIENQSGSTPDKVRFLKFNLFMFPWLRSFFLVAVACILPRNAASPLTPPLCSAQYACPAT
jgi:hypothetical protein